ncbi:uncharacterized protein [Triticum aestivum]|uniref:uncharacterized protein isoform X4 n=1 Tax=Triticum aestivum TaxID=4565 RepID=UPI001D03549D|nr:uncharacterized protein LOC123180834 isoform X4 [Triticum aestivum]XP_044448928.1 uncharacterized protein LOC123180834 isoform X4 [Triticum aestivum]
MQLHCETTGDLVQALVHVRCSDVVIEAGAGANGQSVSPKGGGPCNMKKTIQTKGRYTDSQGCKETCRSAFQSYLFQHQRLNAMEICLNVAFLRVKCLEFSKASTRPEGD